MLGIGLALARAGLVAERRIRRLTALAWPRVVTGLVRISRATADIAMVGIAVGSAGVAGVGFAAPFTAAVDICAGAVATGALALVSQRYGAGATNGVDQVVRTATVLVVCSLLPVAGLYWVGSGPLIGLLAADGETAGLGARYLRFVGLSLPFAGLNTLGVRTLAGTDDARTAMVLRSGGAVLNVGLNAALIFGAGLGVTGAALGTLLSTAAVTAAFAVGLVAGRLPGVGAFPVAVSPRGRYLDGTVAGDIASIGLPVAGKKLVLTGARLPILALVGLFGPAVVAAYVISWRLARLMNVPGWGFGLATSSLVGQALGGGDEASAEAYCRDSLWLAVTTYLLVALSVAVFADRLVVLFVTDPTTRTATLGTGLVRAACVAVVFRGVTSSVGGALDASGDTRWPFYGRALGMCGFVLPLVSLGATTSLGLWGLYAGYLAQTVVPAAVNYYRFATGRWKTVSKQYRSEVDG